MEIKIAAIGNVDSAKSTTISCLANNILDDGRGFARKKILKYTHEAISGRTSSITHHYLKTDDNIIDFVDLAGHEKYLKTTATGLNSSFIDYAMVTIGSDRGIIGMTKEHIILALALKLPIFIVITKIDVAKQHKLEKILNRIITIMSSKAAGKKKCIVIKEHDSIDKLNNFANKNICPIFLTSNTKGTNLPNLRSFVTGLKSTNNWKTLVNNNSVFIIDEAFKVVGVGLVVSGLVKEGIIRIGDKISIGPFSGKFKEVVVKSIHDNFRNNIDYLEAGFSGCLNIKPVNTKKEAINKTMIRRGKVCLKTPKCIREFDAEVTILHHPTTIKVNYQPFIHCGSVRQCARICHMDKQLIRTGDKAIVKFKFMFHPEFVETNSTLIFREGKTKGIGKIISVKYN